MKSVLFAAALMPGLCSTAAHACGPEPVMREQAVRALYADADVARYVCVDNGDCAIGEFASKLDVKPVTLGPGITGIQVEPQQKGLQYFSALFRQQDCKYEMVLAPDTTLSSVKLLPRQKNALYMVRAVERDATDVWKEIDFAYDPAQHQYALAATRCYRARGGKAVTVRCDG
jgi:hypothetical protein